MPGWFITAIVFLILAALIWAASYFIPKGDRSVRPVVRLGAGVVAVLALLCLMLSSFDIVGTRNVGIVTSFGKPVGERGAGLAWHAPWQKISEMDAAIQLQSFQGNSYDEPQTAIKVRLANNSAAYVEENLNWRIREPAAGSLFQDYRTFENITVNLVDKQAQVALSKEFSTFNPQLAEVVDPTKPPPTTTQMAPAQGANLPVMAERVKQDLQNAVGDRIEIIDVRIPGIFYDSATQQRIDQYNQKVQETKNAQQDVQTATQQKLASEQRANQAPPDLRVAIFNCINELVKAGKDPAGCWGQIGTGGNPLIQIPLPPK
jgi:regulator of protease activity HflC (stomatin/prohibitin superfamily)